MRLIDFLSGTTFSRAGPQLCRARFETSENGATESVRGGGYSLDLRLRARSNERSGKLDEVEGQGAIAQG